MIPIIWRFLLGQYFKVLLLCAATFLGVMLTTRLDDIAHFAALGTSWRHVLWFTWHQIPYVLPIVLPISCLISVLLLIQRLSRFHELTALRACGLGLRDILTPILLAAAVLAMGNFILVSEVATHSHLTSGLLKNQMRAVNPLLFLKNKHLRKMHGIHFEALGPTQIGESVHQAVIALPDRKQKRIMLLMINNLKTSPDTFEGEGMSIVSCLEAGGACEFDSFIIENSSHSITQVSDFMELFYKRAWRVSQDQLQLPLLLGQLSSIKETPPHEAKMTTAPIYSEILRRISLALAVFTFTLMGAAFGMSISRTRSYRGLITVITLASVTLVAYFSAKGLAHILIASAILYLLPHILIVFLSIWMLKRITKGIG